MPGHFFLHADLQVLLEEVIMKNVMLSVLGLSPQVLTEAVYALFSQGRHVDEIHVVTTRTGRDGVHAGLLASGQGEFYKFLDEYGIVRDSVRFPPENIHVLRDENGYELEDIITPEDNELLVKKCMELAWKLTSRPDQSVFFMIAGGRKTMSASLALAAQFYGRPCDRIYHVLVSPEFENCRDFYFPPRKSRLVRTVDAKGKTLYRDTRDARIWLVSMPFVSVRERLSDSDLNSPADPEKLLMSLIRDNPPRLMVDLADSKITYKGRELDIKPVQMALLAFFAQLRIECGCGKGVAACQRCCPTVSEIVENSETRRKIRKIFQKIAEHINYLGMTSDSGIKNIDYANFSTYRSKLNRVLKRSFGADAMEIQISSFGPKNSKRYGIKLEPKYIEVKT